MLGRGMNGTLRRSIVRLAVVTAVIGAVGLQATAGAIVPRRHHATSKTIRSDPNDSQSPLDIHRVVTEHGRRRITLRVRTWDPFTFADLRHGSLGDIRWDFDLRGDREFDRQVVMFDHDRHRDGGCVVVGEVTIGERAAFHPDPRDLVCKLPRAWLHANKPVTFRVWSQIRPHGSPHWLYDRAPDHNRRYSGL